MATPKVCAAYRDFIRTAMRTFRHDRGPVRQIRKDMRTLLPIMPEQILIDQLVDGKSFVSTIVPAQYNPETDNYRVTVTPDMVERGTIGLEEVKLTENDLKRMDDYVKKGGK